MNFEKLPPVMQLSEWKDRLRPRVLGFRELLRALGVAFFSFGGTSAIPEVGEMMRSRRESLPKVLSFSGYTVLSLYALFSISMVGVGGRLADGHIILFCNSAQI